ncbi:hypothetical protein CRENBAI_010718 [Crenichthys baileyi]|uniref:Uncharacterized protein n=1 Tax=Crenichthys baileyi TaxID=28760 RepID=A0AAV9SFU5_9TELE
MRKCSVGSRVLVSDSWISKKAQSGLMDLVPVQAPEDLRRNVLYEALRCSSSDAESIPDRLKLPLCVTRFWFQYRQQNHPGRLNMSCLQALVLGFVYGEADADPEFKARMDGLEPGSSCLEPDVAHAFSQWQNCMRQSLHLNQLLSFPLPEPRCSWLYCGPLLHKLQNALLRHISTFKELKDLLAERWRVLLETLLKSAGLGPWDGAGPSAGVGPSGDDEGWQSQTRKKRRN